MRIVILVIGMALAAYLTATYLTHPSIRTADGQKAPDPIMENVKANLAKSNQAEDDLARKAAQTAAGQ